MVTMSMSPDTLLNCCYPNQYLFIDSLLNSEMTKALVTQNEQNGVVCIIWFYAAFRNVVGNSLQLNAYACFIETKYCDSLHFMYHIPSLICPKLRAA